VISRLLEALLTLAADDFRSRYGAEVIQVHQERAAVQRGPIQWLLFGGRELVGIVWLVVRSRLGQRHRGVGGTTTRGRGGSMVDTIGQDLRFAFRTLTRNPAFAATAVAVLALGIGANTAIFSAVNAFFFRPLPFADPDRLVMLYETNPEFGWQHAGGAPANVLDWREQVDAFQDVAMYTEHVGSFTHVREGEPELLGVTNVSGNFFSVLGVPAALGRAFEWDETWEGNDGVIILSHALWETHFGADPGVVGRTVELSGTTVEIVGVMPDGFSFPSDQTQMWSPWGWATDARDQVWFRRAHWVRPVARLAPGVSPTEADGQLQVVVHRLQTEYPETNRVMGAGLMPLRSFLVREVRMPLMVLLGAVSLLLLLACANVANLMLVRASERSREVALRHALGAGRRRVVRQFLTESLVMAFLGGTLGLGLGWAGVRAMERLTALGIDGATAIALDARVVLFTLAVALFSGVVFGLAPALNSTGSRLGEALKDGGRGGTAGRQGLRTVNLLVATEVALALLLVVGAGLMVRSFWLLRDVDPGFQVEGTLAVQLTVPSTRYAERDQVLAFYDQLTEALEGRPGIERAGTVGHLPLAGQSWSSQFQAEGWPPDRVGFEIVHRRADPGYFEALGIPLVRGRMFDSSDGPEAPLVVVVNETFAREHFPGEDPLGQKIAYDRAATAESTWYEIVGIVGDQHQNSPGQPVVAEVFENRDQDWGRFSWIVMRTSMEPMSVVPVFRSVLREMDPLIPVASVRPLEEVWRTSMAREEFILTLLGVFGAVALVLAAVGVYGVTAQAARKRTQEIGIRMALGAAAPDVLSMLLRQALRVVGLGLAVGLVATLLTTRVLTTLLFGVAPTDPGTLAAVVVLLGGVALLACYVPALRATRVDPVRSLRAE
jgi:putative ABC transport system permease protein